MANRVGLTKSRVHQFSPVFVAGSSMMGGGRFYQWRRGNGIGAAVALTTSLFFLVTANDSGRGRRFGGYVTVSGAVGLALCISFLLLAVRALRCGLVVEENSITVRNLFGTRTIGWQDVAGFEMAGFRLLPSLPVPGIRLRSGRVLRISGLAGRNALGLGSSRQRFAEQCVTELNRLLEEKRQPGV